MQYQQAMDDFLLYLEVEQNYSPNTIRSYKYDLHLFLSFLEQNKRPTGLKDLNSSVVRRFVQDQMMNQNMKPRSMQRKISSLKSFSKYCIKNAWSHVTLWLALRL